MIAAPPPIALSASPPRIALVARDTRELRVTNAGRAPAVIAVVPAGFTLALRGRPRVQSQRHPAWLRLTPARLRLAAGSTATVTVSGRPGPGLAPGDHAALVLLRTRPRNGDIAVRMQIGIVVVMRVPGAIKHRLRLQAVKVRRRGLELVIANGGNVSERLGSGRLRITLMRGRRVLARLRPAALEVLPHTRGVVAIPYRARGRFTVVVALDGTVRRSFRARAPAKRER